MPQLRQHQRLQLTMAVALVVVCALVGAAAAGSAVGKLTAHPKSVEAMQSVGVTPKQMRLLGVIELVGVAGLLVGIWVPVLGAAAAIGLVLYFVGAVAAHLRKGHGVAEWAPAAVILAVAVASAVLQVKR